MLESVKQSPKWLSFLLVSPLIAINLWMISKIFDSAQPSITLFIIANLLAFILDKPIQLLQRWGVQRLYGILLILAITGLIITAFSLMLAPLFLNQLSELVNYLPNWIHSGEQQIKSLEGWLSNHRLPIDLTGTSQQINHFLPDELIMLPNQLLDFLFGLTDRVIEVLLTVVFTLYLLLHGQSFWDGIFDRLPAIELLRPILRQQFQNYFAGQMLIASLMAVLLTIAFFMLHVPYWLVFGLGIGTMGLIPFGDSLAILGVSLFVSLKSAFLGGEVLVVSILVDQFIDNVISPRILAKLVGLNPLWIIIALIVGSKLAGIVGVLIAVPTASAIKVVLDELWPVVPQKNEEVDNSTILTSSTIC